MQPLDFEPLQRELCALRREQEQARRRADRYAAIAGKLDNRVHQLQKPIDAITHLIEVYQCIGGTDRTDTH